jgi:hypothetical protein
MTVFLDIELLGGIFMRYIVDTEKARTIYDTVENSCKVMVMAAAAIPFGVMITMLCRNYAAAPILGVCTLITCCIFVAAMVQYVRFRGHLATRYIELMDHIRPKILGCHVRAPRGCTGYDGMQEVYFTYADETGEPVEFVLGVVDETTRHNLDAPMVDITKQKFYV